MLLVMHAIVSTVLHIRVNDSRLLHLSLSIYSIPPLLPTITSISLLWKDSVKKKNKWFSASENSTFRFSEAVANLQIFRSSWADVPL